MMKLTKAKTKEFFNLIKNENVDTYIESIEILNQYPELKNSIVSGMAKGIDGYSSLMLAIRFYKFKFAIELIKRGADVNFIDHSPAREQYRPIFIDLLEMLSNLIDLDEAESLNEGLEVWQIIESHGLDYSKKTISISSLIKPENCLEAYIRFVSARYGNNHKIHHETKYDPPNPYVSKYIFSEESKDEGKEKMYELVMEKLIGSITEGFFIEMDANKYRHSGHLFEIAPEQYMVVDSFSLEIANKHLNKKFGYTLKNMDGDSYVNTYKIVARKTYSKQKY